MKGPECVHMLETIRTVSLLAQLLFEGASDPLRKASGLLEVMTERDRSHPHGDDCRWPGARKGEPLPWIVSDSLRERMEPLSPKVWRRTGHPGRKRPDDRKALREVLLVLCTRVQGQ